MTLEVAIGCDSTENLSYFMYCSWQYGLQNSLSCALDSTLQLPDGSLTKNCVK